MSVALLSLVRIKCNYLIIIYILCVPEHITTLRNKVKTRVRD